MRRDRCSDHTSWRPCDSASSVLLCGAPRVLLLDVPSGWVRAGARRRSSRQESLYGAALHLRASLLLLVAVPRRWHHGLRFDAPHRDCRDRLSGQRLILLLVEHGRRPLRAFTINEVLGAPRRSAGLRAVPRCSVQLGGVAAMRRAFLVKPKR